MISIIVYMEVVRFRQRVATMMHDICWEVTLFYPAVVEECPWLWFLTLSLKKGAVLFMHVLVHSSMKERPTSLAASTCKIFDRWPKV